jgi:carbamoyltransferase
MNNQYYIGLNIGKIDPSATLFKNTHVVAHVEEERFTRRKKGVGQFPINAIQYCLSLCPNGIEDIKAINLGFDLDMFLLKVPQYYISEWAQYPTKPSESSVYEINRLKEKNPKNVTNKITQELESIGINKNQIPLINWYNHHYCHALSGHLSSPFKNSLGVVVDANSELDTVSVWDCKGTNLTKIYSKELPDSLGWLYRTFTLFCGFEAYEGEGMMMGLAPYGRPNKQIAKKIEKILKWKTNESGEFDFEVDSKFVYLDEKYESDKNFTKRFIEIFGKPALQNQEEVEEYYKDIAFEIQDRFEKTLLQFVERFIKKTKHKYLTLSGGVFLNCKATGYIWRNIEKLKDVYIVPMASDDGIGLGANFAYALENISTKRENFVLENAYLGMSYSNKEIKESIDHFEIRDEFKNNLQYSALIRSLGLDISLNLLKTNLKKNDEDFQIKVTNFLDKQTTLSSNTTTEIAQEISDGKVVAWFQGRMEAGPRALGNRSILADPRRMESLIKVNQKVKFRQKWRPFCPTVLNDFAEIYFDKPTQSPNMINTFKCSDICVQKAPAIVHVDKTARPQFLTKEQNPRFEELIRNFYDLTEVPILMNTSMNIKGEPICSTPEDALNFFFATDIDILVLGDYVIRKYK